MKKQQAKQVTAEKLKSYYEESYRLTPRFV
ncbi:hypothetical protein ME7_00965 [Bartonella birtlesii LL-WM9]|uniref:Uncharacterized protein n=1 Tax=Bartonella birtlesii LL-WM9 TaxID=1094552 RepID=J0PV15_9HYPH|nr:hypothetical protein ME7_00961 [Bartonella birtlesii LL-WM9]EJF76421.1 hypothetical protein ME7_00965 [Bartonella birtlesii LL-WM9]